MSPAPRPTPRHPTDCGAVSRPVGKGTRRELHPQLIPSACDCGLTALIDFAKQLVARHDRDAAREKLPPGETGPLMCGCVACTDAERALRKAGAL